MKGLRSNGSPHKEGYMKRRSLLKGMAAGAMAGVAGMRAPGVLGQAKPFAGVTINGACFRWTG
jgi:hypothetical protein